MSEVLRILLLLALVGTCVNQCKIPTCEWGGLMNTYRKGIGTALQGSQTVIASLSRRGYGIPLQPGDLLLIIQMQGAHINPENSIAYGDGSTGSGVTNLENVGVYEFVRVDDVHTELTSIEITLSSPLVHSYESLPISDVSGASTFQVVRVPECEVATLIGDVVCASWDGESGGIVALNAQKSITFAGNEIRCPGRGFRGAGPLLFMSQQPLDSTDDYVSTSRILTTDGNALKGEGIAGTPLRVRARDGTITGTINDPFGYPGGDFAVGAPGNAGGGGNEHNNGGGGGGLGGRGGDGGKFYLSVIQSNGLGGGAVLDGSNVPYEDRLFLGGGGGAGHANNGQNFGWGGVGGGIVVIIAPRFLDYVVVDVSGSNGNPASIVEIDATGGGGAGGTALLASPNGRLEHAGISVNAMGGRAYQAADGHGGGGGGGGGIILVEQNNVGGTVIPMLDGGTIIPIGAADPRDGDPGFPGMIAYITLNNMLGTIFLGFPSCSSSLSPTPSMTSSGTSSGTSTHSTTGSTSLSVTRSISITGSVTISITPTTSPSETKTSTASPSETRTVTRSISPTSTASKTPPATTSPTPSVSGSSSFSISLSSSISPLPIPVTVSASTKTPVANSTAPQPQETPSTGIKPTVILPSTSPFAIPSEIGVGNGGGVFVGPRDEGTEIIFLPPTEDAIEAINEFSIASNIVNIISLINGVESQPNGPVTICLEVDSKDDACLSYYNEKTREWECEDPCLEYKGGVACGETDHFTNFAVILSGGGNGIGGRCSSNEGDWILGAGWKDSILIGCVTGVCCCFVVFVILLGTFLPKLRQKGHNNVTIVGE